MNPEFINIFPAVPANPTALPGIKLDANDPILSIVNRLAAPPAAPPAAPAAPGAPNIIGLMNELAAEEIPKLANAFTYGFLIFLVNLFATYDVPMSNRKLPIPDIKFPPALEPLPPVGFSAILLKISFVFSCKFIVDCSLTSCALR